MPVKTVAIHQSQYLPWPLYFKKMAAADLFVLMDSVQFQKNGFQNRTQVRNAPGMFWLTIPVSGHLGDTIHQRRIADPRWPVRHWKSLEAAYRRAPFWPELGPELAALYQREWHTLGEVNTLFLAFIVEKLGIRTPMVTLSELGVAGAKSELVLNICRAVGADRYLSGSGGQGYLQEEPFRQAGIAIHYLMESPPVYAQFHGPFVPGLSVLDMAFNVGLEGVRDHLRLSGPA